MRSPLSRLFRTPPRATRSAFRPHLVSLDDRAVPATLTVTSTADSGPGTLRQAVLDAAANAEDDRINIDFAIAGQTITLLSPIAFTDTSKAVEVTSPLISTVSGGNATQLFTVATGATVKISQFTLTGGKAADGGAVANNGTLTLSGVTLTGNQATNDGGAVKNAGTLRATDSTFSANTAGNSGGAIANAGTLVFVQSTAGESVDPATQATRAGNTAANGGGIFNDTAGKLFVINATIHKNTATAGGGVQNVSTQFAKFTNSTVAFNTGGGVNTGAGGVTVANNTIVIGNAGGDLTGAAVGTSKNNLVGDAATAGGLTAGANGNIVGVADAKTVLDALFTQFTTPFYPLVKTSPAVDKGDNALAVDEAGAKLLTDQSGTSPRFQPDPNGTVDIGARELLILPAVSIAGLPAAVTTPKDKTATAPFATAIISSDTGTAPLLVTFTATKGTFTIPATIANVSNITGSGTGTISFTAANDGGALGAVAVIDYVPPAGASFSQAAGEKITITAKNTVTNDTKTADVPLAVGAAGGGPLLVGTPRTVVGSDKGTPGVVQIFNPDKSAVFPQAFQPFDPAFTGGVRTAAADFNNDGTPDYVAGTGPGVATQVVVYDGTTGKVLFTVAPFEASFTGGVYVTAGDVTGDGVPDLAITPDEGGGPRVDVYSGAGFGKAASFFGIDDPNFRGGARASIGDLNGDGTGDLLVVAGFGGGPRVAAFDGKTVGGTPVKLFGDFFAFEQTLRNGIFAAVGDVNGDGIADLVAGGGPGGGPRVTVFDGKDLLNNVQTPIANFFGGDPNSRGGIRVAVKNLDGDAKADIVVGAGTGAGSKVTSYLGKDVTAGSPPAENFAFDAVAGFTGGVFVG